MSAAKKAKRSEASPKNPKKPIEKLPKDATELELNRETGVSQEVLEYVSANFPNLKSLTVGLDDDYDYIPTLSFHYLPFPKLESISLTCIKLTGLHFEKANYPMLESINIECITGAVPYFRLDLPTLKSFSAQHTTIIDASDFASSLSRCTKLEDFDCYKLRGLSSSPQNKIYMPNCETFGLYRSEDLNSIELYAPKLVEFNLQGCHSLDHVRLVDEPFGRRVKCFCCGREETDSFLLQKCATCKVAQYCSKECQEKHWDEHSKRCKKIIAVNLVNANVDVVSLKRLKKNPRIKEICRSLEQANMFGFSIW